ncbi:hypothetical protein IAT38_002459 [Cryptococcus sp. DSM 104549]
MPPKKDTKEVKEKPIKGDQAEEMVLSYMRDMNRPFASADVTANLKNKVPKTVAVKCLATLAEKGQLTVKPYGKQLIYLYNQSLLDVLAPAQLGDLDGQIKATQGQLEERRKELRSLQSELSAKEALPKTEELDKEIARIQAENDITLRALLPFRGTADAQATVAPMSADDTAKIDKEFTRWRKEWVDRRKVYKDLLGMLSEGGQVQSVSAFEEDQGITPDDEEALAVEQGEFCKPQVVVRAARPKAAGVQKLGGGGGVGAKRPGSLSSQEGGKKKAKKA